LKDADEEEDDVGHGEKFREGVEENVEEEKQMLTK